MIKRFPVVLILFLFACKSKVEKIKPTIEPISESIYASGIIKSENQYKAFASVNGIVEKPGIINILNAPSPAATSSLSIGQTVAELAIERLV